MIDSIISSHHHYYIFFFQSEKIKTLKNVASIFDGRTDYEIIQVGKNKDLEFCHIQVEIARPFGSESVLSLLLSKNKRGGPFYWYDFYIGKIDIGEKRYFFICYPYSKLGKYLERVFHSKNIQTSFYTPELEVILKYMRDRNTKGLSKIEKKGFIADIVRYSALVKEDDDSANKVNIIGESPLKSKTYNLLKSSEDITVETRSLKLRCKQLDIGDVEMSFDKLGNYRMWIRRMAQKENIPVVPFVFKFLMEIAPLQEKNFVSTNTLLEDD